MSIENASLCDVMCLVFEREVIVFPRPKYLKNGFLQFFSFPCVGIVIVIVCVFVFFFLIRRTVHAFSLKFAYVPFVELYMPNIIFSDFTVFNQYSFNRWPWFAVIWKSLILLLTLYI